MSKYNLSNTPTIWDAKQLIKSYVNLFYFRENLRDDSDFVNVSHSDQIRMKRLYSAICAFNGLEYDEGKVLSTIDETFGRASFRHKDYSEDFVSYLKTKISEIIIPNLPNKEIWKERLERDEFFNPGFLFLALIRYRINLERLLNSYSGIMESSMSFALGSNFVKSCFLKDIEKQAEVFDEILGLLLDEKFLNKSFSEVELKADWHFPTETDSDLLDWDID